ncbi:MAG: hypothetical protein M3437_06780 [Chloroflexota bacterium]|nr:hypothetical protein [Chloroflexota bacterium]MDQ5866279.1 hypothetical protein [Chloroflexota bacterium]
MRSKITSFVLALLTLLAASQYAPGSIASPTSQADSRTFPETGHTVKGKFLKYWDEHGGLAQQGYPISGEMQEQSDTDGKTYTVQYFERAVFEAHPENQPPNDVLLSLLGVFLYKQKYDGSTRAPSQTPSTAPDAVKFPETGKSVGGKFLAYWKAHGGLPQQGLPISDEFQEKSDLDGKTYTVQYFERAVFERHPENGGTPYEILLSQLGTFRYRSRYETPVARATPSNIPAAETAIPTATATGNEVGALGPEDYRVDFTSQAGQQAHSIVDNTADTNDPAFTLNQDQSFIADHKEMMKRIGIGDRSEYRTTFQGFSDGSEDGAQWHEYSFSISRNGSRDIGFKAIYRRTSEGNLLIKLVDRDNFDRILLDKGLTGIYSSIILELKLRHDATPKGNTDVISRNDFLRRLGIDEIGLRLAHRIGMNVRGYPQNIENNPWDIFYSLARR